MQKCIIYHTGVYESAKGVIKDNKVYLQGEDDTLYFPEAMFMAREECEGGRIQFEVEGKWGFADIYTGEMIINPVWDYVGPFYSGYAKVALGVQLEEGPFMEIQGEKQGYIDKQGEIIIPLEYDGAEEIPYREYFKVAKNGKWGLIDHENKTIIPFLWNDLQTSYNHHLIFCRIEENDYSPKWGVYDQNHHLIVQPELDEIISPKIKHSPRSTSFSYYEEYYILKRKEKYGVLCNDGRWIANIEFSKEQAIAMVNTISGNLKGDLYI